MHAGHAPACIPFLRNLSPRLSCYKTWELSIPPEYRNIPPSIKGYIVESNRAGGQQIQPDLFYLLVVSWSRIHGIVMLELFNHLQPVVGDAEAFYLNEVNARMTSGRFEGLTTSRRYFPAYSLQSLASSMAFTSSGVSLTSTLPRVSVS